MITSSTFGTNGRLGNQMFQFSTLYSVAKQLNTSMFLPTESTDDFRQWNLEKSNCSFLDRKSFGNLYYRSITQKFSEPYFHYSDLTAKDNTDFHGYFQSEKYFENYKTELQELFLPKTKSATCVHYERLMADNRSVSIHLRRGDYVGKSNYHTDLSSTSYYEDAIQLFAERNFVVFSDDNEYAKLRFKHLPNVTFVEGTTPVEDIYLQSVCFGNIVANSSFSWWGAWLNQKLNTVVVAPRRWFGTDCKESAKDVFCKTWVLR